MKQHEHLSCVFLVLLATLLFPDWRTDRWGIESFSGQYGGGLTTGPVIDAGVYSSFPDLQVKYPGRMCADTSGNRYFENNGIQIIYPNGQSETIVPMANLIDGYHDGPSRTARFDVGSYLGNWNYGCNKSGNIYVDDAGNQRIRKVFKDGSGKWMVSTYAGGGTTVPDIGSSCTVTQFKTGYNIIVAVNSMGLVHVANGGANKVFRISLDGLTVETLDSLKEDALSVGNVVDGDADTVGNVYFITRGPGRIIKVDSQGIVTRFDINQYFETLPTCISASQDGSCVYVASSKDKKLRRFPMYGSDPVSILCTDGMFHDFEPSVGEIKVDDSKQQFTDAATAKFAFIAQLHGHDTDGNMYISVHGWEAYGVTGSHGLCTTRIAKLIRR